MKLGIVGIIFLLGIMSISIISIEQAWAANATTFKELRENPGESFLSVDGTGTAFFAFILGIAIYALFVWHFYRRERRRRRA